MQKDVQAYVAYTAARINANWKESELLDKNRGERISTGEEILGYRLEKYPFRDGCDANKCRAGTNYCLVDSDGDRHICLSVYGKLFDGYNRDNVCHFSGMVYDDAVEIYDYNESDFFRFEKV